MSAALKLGLMTVQWRSVNLFFPATPILVSHDFSFVCQYTAFAFLFVNASRFTIVLFDYPFCSSGSLRDLPVADGDERLGLTMELCAGIMDKKATAEEIGICRCGRGEGGSGRIFYEH